MEEYNKALEGKTDQQKQDYTATIFGQEAMSGIKNDVAELSIEIASKIIQKELNAEDQKALVDSYIEGLGKQNGIR